MGSVSPKAQPKNSAQNGQHQSPEMHSNGFCGNGEGQQEILEPIAVVGISLKFPEDAISEDSFWEMMLEKRCVSTEFPKERINIDAFHDSDPNQSNTVSICIVIFDESRSSHWC